MTQQHIWRRRLILGLCVFLAIEFIIGGGMKFLPGETFFGPPYSEKFVEWGYPSWFRFLVGVGEATGGVLLLTRRRFLGAALLVVILVGAVITHIANVSPLNEAASAPTHLILVSIAAWATRPAHWREVGTLLRIAPQRP